MHRPHWLVVSTVCLSASGLWAAELTSVDPRLVSTAGGTVVTLNGSGFQAGDAVRILSQSASDVRMLQGVQVVDSTRIRGTLPGLTQGLHDVQVVRGNLVVIVAAELHGAIEAANPPSLRSLTPGELCAEGGTPVTVRGANLRPETVIRIGSRELVRPAVTRDGSEITGFAPALES